MNWDRHPWLGFIEEAADGDLKHLKSGTVFPGTYPMILARAASSLEGLILILNPTAEILGAPKVTELRFPLCQLEDI